MTIEQLYERRYFATSVDVMKRTQLIIWLTNWRMAMGLSVSEYNLRRTLESRRTPELRMMVKNLR